MIYALEVWVFYEKIQDVYENDEDGPHEQLFYQSFENYFNIFVH